MIKKLIALVLAVILLLSFSISVYADINTPCDVPVPWTENKEMRNITNEHFLVWTRAAIATGISFIAGGTAAFWTGLVTGIMANAVCTETHNVYFDIHYYWQPSYTDPQLPYYIKQVTYCYSDLERTDYIGSKTRYYYSNMPY